VDLAISTTGRVCIPETGKTCNFNSAAKEGLKVALHEKIKMNLSSMSSRDERWITSSRLDRKAGYQVPSLPWFSA
jgi:hypothetical protein